MALLFTREFISFLNYMKDKKELDKILEDFKQDYKGSQHIKFKESLKQDLNELIKELTVQGGLY